MPQESLDAGLNGFKNAFAERVKNNAKQNIAKPPEKRSKARAALKMSGPASEMWQSFEKSFPPSLQFKKLDGLMCEPCYLGVEAGNVGCGVEPDYMASLRLVLEGTRTLIAAPVSALNTVFGAMEPSLYWKKFMDASIEELGELEKTGQLYQATYGKHELCYLPTGWVFGERILDAKDMIGFTVRGLCQMETKSCYSEIQLIRKLLQQSQKEEKGLPAILEALEHIRTNLEAAAAAAAPKPADGQDGQAPSLAAEAGLGESGKTGKGKGVVVKTGWGELWRSFPTQSSCFLLCGLWAVSLCMG